MKSMGIFEVKTRLSEICEEVARTGRSVVVTRRGKPLVRIDPVVGESSSVWEARTAYIADRGPMREEFEVPARSPELPTSPLED